MHIPLGLTKGPLLEQFKDKDFLAKYEGDSKKVLYGFYEGDTLIELAYYPIKYAPVEEDTKWTFNGKEVAYKRLNNGETQVVFTGIATEKGGFHITYHLSDEFTEEDAKNFTKFLSDDLSKR